MHNSTILELWLYCPECDNYRRVDIPLSKTPDVETLCTIIEDARVQCPTCGEMFMGIVQVAFCDYKNTYELPLWHGPVAGLPDEDSGE